MAFWNGNKTLATYPRRTHIPPLDAPTPPDSLKAELTGDTLDADMERGGGRKGVSRVPLHAGTARMDARRQHPHGNAVENGLESDGLHRCAVVAIDGTGRGKRVLQCRGRSCA